MDFFYVMAFIFLVPISVGIAMIWAVRWSRRKSEEFQKTETGKHYKNPLEGKPLLEQLKSRETWERVKDGLSRHDPSSDKAKAIRHDVTGYLGTVPFVIVALITIGVIFILRS